MISDSRSAGDALSLARRVIREEAAALEDLAGSLGSGFAACVETLFRARGRVAVTGIGKSGHVARKIAATFNSTGTPAYFIHPSEASHGDLGCVAADDVLLALSNSGESAELGDILAFAARRNLPVLAMTKNPRSFLGRQAVNILLLPDAGEAGPLGCAPTTSTTMMMALGDALAMSLLQLRGFTSEEFAAFHPGGQLGRKLLLVRNIMHEGDAVPMTDISTPMREALYIMTGKGFGCVAVTDRGRLAGIVSDGDLRRHMSADLLEKTAGEVMTPNPATVSADAPAAKALGVMSEKKITGLLIADENGEVVGIVHMHDCLRAGLE